VSDYSPKRRTALVLLGTGTSGAYHAGVLKALDETGAKIELVVGSGVGAVGAAFAAAASSARLYGPAGFWTDVEWASLYRLRRPLRLVLFLLGLAFGVFLLPVFFALLVGMLFPLVLVADLAVPGLPAQVLSNPWSMPGALRDPYVAALAVPVFLLSVSATVYAAAVGVRLRRRYAEAFESAIDPAPATTRLRDALWDVCRGQVTATRPGSDTELGQKFVGVLAENLGQPGFRELVVRATDLDSGEVLPFALLADPHRAAFVAQRSRESRSPDGQPAMVDLRQSDGMLFDAVLTGLLPPLVAPVRRVAFSRHGLYGGEVHRLSEAPAGDSIADAITAGADQVIVVTAVPESAAAPRRRRGLAALVDAHAAVQERRGVEAELRGAARINRIVRTVGHRQEDGRNAWQDPATGRTYREVSIYVIRPERRAIGPLEWNGSLDPATEVREEPHDLIEQGYRDAHRLFIDPVLGGSEPRTQEAERPVAMEL
jgi:hypothetical protein